MGAIETYELRGGYRVTVEHDRDADNPRTEYDGGTLRLVPLEVLDGDGRLSRHLESLGFDEVYELGNLAEAWERLGGESGERFAFGADERRPGGMGWTAVPGWPPLGDFDGTPVARWARIFHGVELETVEAGDVRAVAWIDLELCGQYGMPAPEDRAGALAMIARELAPYNAWAAGDVYGVVIEDKHGEELGACWGLYLLDPFNEAGVLEAASGYTGGKVDRRVSERLEHVREVDAWRKRASRAEALARHERNRGEARAAEARAASKREALEWGLRALATLDEGMVTIDEIAGAFRHEIGHLAPLEAAGKRDAARAEAFISELGR